MTQRNESPATNRAHRSEMDRRAIDATAHLLLGIVWLERRLVSAPDQIGSRTDLSGRRELTRRLWNPVGAGPAAIASRGSRDPVGHE